MMRQSFSGRSIMSMCFTPNSPSASTAAFTTAGVDPSARRDFWEELHALAAKGISILVSTHYMDEASRCHKLAYIAYGRLLAQGTVDEVIASQRLTTFALAGRDLARLSEKLRGQPGVEQTAAFGDTIHVTGRDGALLEQTLREAIKGTGISLERVDTGLEDVFIHLMTQATDNWGGNGDGGKASASAPAKATAESKR